MTGMFDGTSNVRLVDEFHMALGQTKDSLWHLVADVRNLFSRASTRQTSESVDALMAEDIAHLVAIANELGLRGYVYDLNEALKIYSFYRQVEDDTAISEPLFVPEDAALLTSNGVSTIGQLSQLTLKDLHDATNGSLPTMVRIRKTLHLTGRKLAA